MLAPNYCRALPLLMLAALMLRPPSIQAQKDTNPSATAQNSQPRITFDVISVKPNNSGTEDALMTFDQDALRATNTQLHVLLLQAFRIFDSQLVGEPKWASTDRWDINAKIAPGDIALVRNMTFTKRMAMFQDILRQRFGLVTHHETREVPVYALIVSNRGPKMKEAKPQANFDHGIKDFPGEIGGEEGKETAHDALIRYLAEDLQNYVGRPVVDRTGLTGRYDFTLEWNPDDSAAVSPASNSLPSLFTALQEQLGLKLEATKAPVDVLVIDHVERPGTN